MVTPDTVRWLRCRGVEPSFTEVRELLGAEGFEQWLASMKLFLCAYFSADEACATRQGKSIAPVRCGVARAKGLKVRFAFPGAGKRGGLRLAVLAFCAERVVKLAGAWRRKDDPDEGEFQSAFHKHED